MFFLTRPMIYDKKKKKRIFSFEMTRNCDNSKVGVSYISTMRHATRWHPISKKENGGGITHNYRLNYKQFSFTKKKTKGQVFFL